MYSHAGRGKWKDFATCTEAKATLVREGKVPWICNRREEGFFASRIDQGDMVMIPGPMRVRGRVCSFLGVRQPISSACR